MYVYIYIYIYVFTSIHACIQLEERLDLEQKGFYDFETRQHTQLQALTQQLQQAQDQLMAKDRELESKGRQMQTLLDGLAKMETLHVQYQQAAEILKKDRYVHACACACACVCEET